MIEQIIPHGICLKCQGCCRFSQADTAWSPSLLKEEIAILSKNNIPASAINLDMKIHLEPQKNGDVFICPFFNIQNNKCKVYPFRPFECQLYPFLINRHEGMVFLAVDAKCPFIKDNLEGEIFKKHIQYLTHLFNDPPWLNSLKSNPQIIQAYVGATNLTKIEI